MHLRPAGGERLRRGKGRRNPAHHVALIVSVDVAGKGWPVLDCLEGLALGQKGRLVIRSAGPEKVRSLARKLRIQTLPDTDTC